MKYIDADRLRAEIERKRDSALERQKNLEKIGQDTVLNEMIAFELNRLISFVDSLQQEQPKGDLEKEVEKYLLDNADFVIKSTSNEMVNTLARHFYELGLNARKED